MLDEVGPGLATVDAPFSLAGAQIGTRMTVVTLGDGGLALISPVPIDDRLAAALAARGPVRALIAPNAYHHLHLEAATARYPDAAVFLAAGLEAKLGRRPVGARDLGPEPDPLWGGVLEQVVVEGIPAMNEVVFFHPASRTLVLTDLCFHFDPAPGGWTGIFLRIAGAHGRLTASRLMRSLVRDRAKVAAALEQILAWDFDRLVVAHGHVLKRDAKMRFVAATEGLT